MISKYIIYKAKLKIQCEEEKHCYQLQIQSQIDDLEKNNLSYKLEMKEFSDKFSLNGEL